MNRSRQSGPFGLMAALPDFRAVLHAGRQAKAGLDGASSAPDLGVLVVAHRLRMPAQLAVISAVYGAAFGIFPIAWIVFSSILLYRLAVDTGKFEIIKDSIGGLTNDRRLQAMFIAFSFGAFIEGAAGFGAPVAVSGAMLAGLGFNPFYAAGICLLANTAPVAFGSIGIPVTTLANVTGLPVMALSGMVGTLCAMVSIVIPGSIWSGDGRVAARGRGGAGHCRLRLVVCRMQYYVPQTTSDHSLTEHRELADVLVSWWPCQLWKPKTIMRLEGDKPMLLRSSSTPAGSFAAVAALPPACGVRAHLGRSGLRREPRSTCGPTACCLRLLPQSPTLFKRIEVRPPQ